ncbi:MAG TPA: glycosyltransferase family 61 protein, partial [Longimicrobiaceae bacterium]|nr:glycosyltransferase family 61 protein [Longimicrobiaceae bacterium]
APEAPRERIYVSRGDAAHRRVRNEPEVMEALRARGFRCVAPGGMRVAEQAALFASAETVVGPHGSGFANLVFAAPGARVVELFSRNYVNPCFWSVANQSGLEYAYLIEPGTRPPDFVDPHRSGDDMTVDVDALGKLLARLDEERPPTAPGPHADAGDHAYLGPEALIFRGVPDRGTSAGAA